ncbi:MAG: acetyl/propionyl/methylcrotonyl-CoA carboxylase subunit alpha [Robiginitomaculum sp.]
MTKKIKKILIANRGEIACRVMKTCRKMGIASVAVYSDADRKALHVRMADEAVHIGASPAAESYLVIDQIIAACKSSGADAVHPGYGFLSENPEFARRLKKEGITFIGPSPSSMEAMGLKDAAKKLMQKAGVPVTPGYHRKDQNTKLLKTKAGEIGYPVLIKAIAGGGGKGMRKVDAETDFYDALASCQREAKSSFGDERVLIEKYILSPRHIEVQVFGDTHGNVVHMFERDCSLQRRHQKVIEEAPAPGMTDAVRKAMTDAAIQAAKAVNYVGAGTVEFIVDGSGKLCKDGFWFMEMNTRLQVEHPVTEMITGLDLVELQIRVAQGEKLPKQNKIKLKGHALEARIYAEDPANDFMPSIGTVHTFDLYGWHNKDGGGVRIDSGVEDKDQISIFYDPMIAKLIGHGKTRKKAIINAIEAIIHSGLQGVTTNMGFLKRALEHKDFKAAKISTGFIPKYLNALIPKDLTNTPQAFALAAVKLSDANLFSHAGTSPYNMTPWDNSDGWKLNRPASLVWKFNKGGEIITARVQKISFTAWTVCIGGEYFHIERHVPEHKINIRDALGFLNAWGDNLRLDPIELYKDGETLKIHLYQPEAAEIADAGGNTLLAPMPGKIIAVNVKAGDSVTAGDKLIIMEAMKMEMSLEAPRDGVVAIVNYAEGALVSDGEVLLELEKDT